MHDQFNPFSALALRPPEAGQTLSIPRPAGSADAWLLATWAVQRRQSAQPDRPGAGLAVICESALDAQRLAEEIGFFSPELRVRLLPDWETLPYEAFSPHQDLVSDRLLALYEASIGALDVLVVSATTALQRVAPPAFLAGNTFFFRKGQKISADNLREQLQTAGYSPVSQVVTPGEYALRGGLIDLYPTGSTLPFRIELMDDEVESVRVFDPDSQRSVHSVNEIRLLPGREFPSHGQAAQEFRARWREVFEGDPSRCSLYRDAGKGLFGAGIEYYLPLLFDQTGTVFDYLPQENCAIATIGNIDQAFQDFHRDLQSRYRFLKADIERPVLPPEKLYLTAEEFFIAAQPMARLKLSQVDTASAQKGFVALPDIAVDRRAADPVARLRALDHPRIVMTAESPGRRETLAQYLQEHGIDASPAESLQEALTQKAESIALLVAPLHAGLSAPWCGLTLITEGELFSQVARRQRRGKRQAETNIDSIIRDLSELKIGDPVVHIQHGIGRYLGLVHLDMGEGDTEFLQLEYADDAKLYIPVSQLHVIGRYSGANPENAPLHTLGSGQWAKAKRKAAAEPRDTAAELLNIYARRAARQGHAFKFDPAEYERFADGFGFEETPDQLAAIHAVVQDMISGKPMDRLVCGDVGFGKTEVALRAAFMAVMDGKQVAVLCPTTLLAEQHLQTFKDRFADWPVQIAELSRFRTAKEIQAALDGLASGRVDIAIGTHKLLSSGVRFDRLGLAIIDEEHRFGVRQKEALKALRAEVDVLTLTATPIPRTLAMSMEGIRDFSVIATAPQRRLAIKTFVRTENDSVVREALLRELKRGGQCYVLHNQVDTILKRRDELQQLVPEARLEIAHGQMHERDLERVMRDFHQQRFNVLLCTTIIETGIDVPTANTIVIYRADRFGLAQLHQLRGRVGRSHHQAYAYLLTPGEAGMTKDAQKRLEAIQAMEELGSGFFLSMHDLEIRGAGEVLGDQQSGNITEVGFQMYSDMLTSAVNALKAGREPDLEAPLSAVTEINLHTPALLPNDYCGDIHERLTLYKRLANAADAETLEVLEEELVDRFGRPPDPTRTLLETHRLRIFARPIGVQKIDATPDTIVITFGQDSRVDPAKVIRLIQSDTRYRLVGNEKLRMEIAIADITQRARAIREMLAGICL
ncbi:MAG: transcription-repair coupling factor [Burkholderiaceae bacterium]|nr:transcription-repair coupling factor [Burkholderiaceae bacterium]